MCLVDQYENTLWWMRRNTMFGLLFAKILMRRFSIPLVHTSFLSQTTNKMENVLLNFKSGITDGVSQCVLTVLFAAKFLCY